MRSEPRGFTAIEMIVAIALAGVLFAIAIPAFGTLRMTSAFSSAEQAIQGLLSRARWSAINSGRAETRIVLEGNLLRVRAGTAADSPLVASIDASDYDVTIGGTNLPVRLGSRGTRMNPADAVPSITIQNGLISSSTTFAVDPLGRPVIP